MTEDVVIDCTAIDRMAEEAARINRENRREIRRLQRVVSALRYILGALVAVSIAFAALWWLAWARVPSWRFCDTRSQG